MYDRNFELDLISFCLKKPLYLKQHKEKLKEIRFQDKLINIVYKEIFKCLDEYDIVPTESELKKRLVEKMSEHEKFNPVEIDIAQDTAQQVFNRSVTEMTGIGISNYLIEQEAKNISEELVSSNAEDLVKKLHDYEHRLAKLKFFFSDDENLGLNFFSDTGILQAQNLLEDYNSEDCLPSGFKIWDEQLQGGFRKGELCVLLAPTGIGKTANLLNLAVNLIKQNQRVVYLALDNLEGELIQRTVGCLMDRDVSEKLDPGITMEDLAGKFKNKFKNNFWYKHYAPRELTKSKLERYLSRLETYLYDLDLREGVATEFCGKIDCIIIDYLDLMVSESGAGEFWISAEHLAQEVKAILKNRNILGLTATQGGTEAMKSDTLKLYMAQGAKSRFNAPDLIFGISQNDDERMAKPSKFRLTCLKARRTRSNYEIAFQFYKERQIIREDPNFSGPLSYNHKPGTTPTNEDGTLKEQKNEYTVNVNPISSITRTYEQNHGGEK